MRDKRVCIITSSHNPFDTRIFKKECRSLSDAGFEVTLLAPTNITQYTEGIHVLGFGNLNSRLERIKNLLPVSRMLLNQKSHVYHVHEPELLFLLPLVRMLLPRAKFIYDVHENYADAVISEEKHWIASPIKPLIAHIINSIEKCFAKRVDLVIAASPDIEMHFRGCNIISIRNYAPMHIINKAFKERQSRFSRNGRQEIIYTGSLTKTRGILEIIKALELIDPRFAVQFTVTGKFHDADFRKEVEKLPGFKKMVFLGWLTSYEEMISRIINADIAMICFHPDPNLNNAVERSNKLFEYMGMGLPIIVSNLPEWAETVKKYNCGLVVNPLNPVDIASKITYLLGHPQEAIEMGLNGRRAVLEHYSWKDEGEKLVAAYKAMLLEEKSL